MKKSLFVLILVIVLACSTVMFGQGTGLGHELPGTYAPGVHVWQDEDSPTGYTVTFIYEENTHPDPNSSVESPEDQVTPGTITRVTLYSETMLLFDPHVPAYYDPDRTPPTEDSYCLHKGESKDMQHQPEEFVPGLVPAGGSGVHALTRDLVKIPDTNLWHLSLPLPCGAFEYRYVIDSDAYQNRGRLDDPANPTMINAATGVRSLSSMVYVPYSQEKQGTKPFTDRSFVLPRDSEKGTVEFLAYDVVYGVDNNAPGATGVFKPSTAAVNSNYNGKNGPLVTVVDRMKNSRGLAIYLPHGYDPDRVEPYKVLYISMGASGDQIGNELRWFHEGAGVNILDNLIAEGAVEPFIMVSGNWQDLGYNYSSVAHDLFNYVIPLMEDKYNVSTDREGRAFAGLSAGGMLTGQIYLHAADHFAYFGNFSATSSNDGSDATKRGDQAWAAQYPSVIYLGAGKWDFTMGSLFNAMTQLDLNGVPYTYVEVPGGHDWQTWQLLLEDFVRNHLWRDIEG